MMICAFVPGPKRGYIFVRKDKTTVMGNNLRPSLTNVLVPHLQITPLSVGVSVDVKTWRV